MSCIRSQPCGIFNIPLVCDLYILSLKFLCTPASSVPCERVFSKAGEVVSKKRNRLSPKVLEQILFLNKIITPPAPPSKVTQNTVPHLNHISPFTKSVLLSYWQFFFNNQSTFTVLLAKHIIYKNKTVPSSKNTLMAIELITHSQSSCSVIPL